MTVAKAKQLSSFKCDQNSSQQDRKDFDGQVRELFVYFGSYRYFGVPFYHDKDFEIGKCLIWVQDFGYPNLYLGVLI